MMGNKDYLSVGVIWVDVQISQRNFAMRNWTKKIENDYIISENFNKNLKQKRGP